MLTELVPWIVGGVLIAATGGFMCGAFYGARVRPAWINRLPRWLVGFFID